MTTYTPQPLDTSGIVLPDARVGNATKDFDGRLLCCATALESSEKQCLPVCPGSEEHCSTEDGQTESYLDRRACYGVAENSFKALTPRIAEKTREDTREIWAAQRIKESRTYSPERVAGNKNHHCQLHDDQLSESQN